MYITQALVKNIFCRGHNIIVDFVINDETFRNSFPMEYGRLFKKKGKVIQVKVFCTNVVPTFFDFPSRCKKCGRFYKVYCKKCYQDFKTVHMILDRFVDENKEKIKKIMEKECLNSKTVSNWDMIKESFEGTSEINMRIN